MTSIFFLIGQNYMSLFFSWNKTLLLPANLHFSSNIEADWYNQMFSVKFAYQPCVLVGFL